MKKIASAGSIFTGLTVFLLQAGPAYAEDICARAGANFSGLCKIRIESNSGGIVGTIIQVLLILGILIALFFLIYGGIKWMTSGGERAKIDSARSTIINALIGLVIALCAFAIINLVIYFVIGGSTSDLSIPRLID